jgi:U3 small nucleolar RNA-associated protein 14
MVDLVDILDGKAQPYFAHDSDDDAPGPSAKAQTSAIDQVSVDTGAVSDAEMGAESEEETDAGESSDAEDDYDDEEEHEGAISASDDDDDDDAKPGALDSLTAFVSTLDASAKRKADEAEPVSGVQPPPARRRRLLPERTEAGTEGEFAARMGSGRGNLCLTLCSPLTCNLCS